MGIYGTGIYGCDIAEDVRDFCEDVFPLLGVDEGNRLLLKEFDDIISSDIVDNEYASFWYALADWQWKHGILSDAVKNKTAELLRSRAGIDEWLDDCPSDAQKRINVMDALLSRLESPMPEKKLKKAVLKRPKHKTGEIVIIRACGRDYKYAESVWALEYGSLSDIYAPEVAEKICERLDPPLEAYNKYIALLCVGTEKKPHSVYVDGYFDEFSVYAVYNYLSCEKPDLEALKKCGFLPTYVRYANPATNRTEGCRWDYKTTIEYESFRSGAMSYISSVEKLYSIEEAERFDSAIQKNGRSKETVLSIDINELFCEFFYEKERLDRAGIPFDDLQFDDVNGPLLLTSDEVDKKIREEMQNEMINSDYN